MVYTLRHLTSGIRRVGHLFQGRYKAILIQKDSHLLEVCRYVVLNPVRAKAVKRPEQWRWSSYQATAGIEKPHPCLSTEWILKSVRLHEEDCRESIPKVRRRWYKARIDMGSSQGSEHSWRGGIYSHSHRLPQREKGYC